MNPLIVPGKLDSLTQIAQYVLTAAAAAKLGKKAAYRLRLATDEIATNTIVYGYEKSGVGGYLEVQVDLNDRNLTITIEDTAPAYDPTKQSSPEDLDKLPHERQIGGLGIYLAIQGMDEFLYERVGNRNRNIFVVNRPIE